MGEWLLAFGEGALLAGVGLPWCPSAAAHSKGGVADVHTNGQDHLEVVGMGEGKTTLLVWGQGAELNTHLVEVDAQ